MDTPILASMMRSMSEDELEACFQASHGVLEALEADEIANPVQMILVASILCGSVVGSMAEENDIASAEQTAYVAIGAIREAMDSSVLEAVGYDEDEAENLVDELLEALYGKR